MSNRTKGTIAAATIGGLLAGSCVPSGQLKLGDGIEAALPRDWVEVAPRAKNAVQLQRTGKGRNFGATPGNCRNAADATPTLVCSADGAQTWPTTVVVGAGDTPRVSVGSDGFVYVIYQSGNNIMLNKFSSCTAGLGQQVGFPIVVATITRVACPIPGIDRCQGRNTIDSPTVAVDDLDPTHIYVSWAGTTGGGNENIVVADSTDGGQTFPRTVSVNNAGTARRYMPWSCALGGAAHVSWYDRRGATGAQNDLAGYFRGAAAVKGGNLVAQTEVNVAGVNDLQCANFWPSPTNNQNDSESCSTQP
ncbi:MAG: hypothetical protein EXR72_26240 [Myxococcales bacterium]|nr:hypothetical protein [Myxococcales bacterium]